MNKKGQITLFIIVGIIIVALIALILSTRFTPGREVEREIKAAAGTPMQSIRVFVDSCLKKTVEDALLLSGQQGGYLFFPKDTMIVQSEYAPVAFWYYRGENLAPTKSMINDDINKYVSGVLPTCTKDFSDFGGDITASDVKAETNILDDKVIVKINYPIALKEGDRTYTTEIFLIDVPVRLGSIYNIAINFVKELLVSDVLGLENILGIEGVEATFFTYADDTKLLSLKDSNSVLNGKPYVFVFANKFKLNRAPTIDNLVDLVAKVGIETSYDLDATDIDGDSMRFTSMDTLFSIDENTGVITILPSINDIGEHEAGVKVEDSKGNFVIENFRIVVIE